jgi:magnesium transporter
MSLKIIHTKNLRWVDIVGHSSEEDINYLKENFKFHPLDFEDVVTPSIRTKIDEYTNYHFLVLLFPYFDTKNNEIKSTEVDFFVGPDFLVTIHDGKMKTLNNLVHNAHQFDQTRSATMTQGSGFLLIKILEALFKRSNPILDRINTEMVESERNVFQLDVKTLEKLSALKKNIIIYRRIVKMHRYVLDKLMHSGKEYLKFKDSKTLFMDLIEYGENIWNVLSSDKESVESFEETNQSLGTHRINDILQVLTVLSVILAALNLITNIMVFMERSHIEKNYGYTNDLEVLMLVTGIMFLVTAGMLLYFKNRKWL